MGTSSCTPAFAAASAGSRYLAAGLRLHHHPGPLAHARAAEESVAPELRACATPAAAEEARKRSHA